MKKGKFLYMFILIADLKDFASSFHCYRTFCSALFSPGPVLGKRRPEYIPHSLSFKKRDHLGDKKGKGKISFYSIGV
jgi:hypothetical protein